MFTSIRRFPRARFLLAIFAGAPVLFTAVALAQAGDAVQGATAATPAAPTPGAGEEVSPVPAIQALRPVLDNIGVVIAGLSIARWKAPGDVRSSTQQDADSIQRDLQNTLPALLTQAQTPGALAPAFAVYRNIDALYDVLLRVSEMASLAGSPDATRLEDSRGKLESARSQLGNLLLQSVSAQDTKLVELRAAVAHAAEAKPAAAPPARVVVEDGATPAPKRKKKPATPAAKPPANSTPAPKPPSN